VRSDKQVNAIIAFTGGPGAKIAQEADEMIKLRDERRVRNRVFLSKQSREKGNGMLVDR